MRCSRKIVRLASLLLLFPLAACPPDPDSDSGTPTQPQPRTPTSISLSQVAVTLDEGVGLQLTATVLDQFGSPVVNPPAISWSSDAAGVAAVSASGMVTGVAAGQTNVRASAGGLAAAAQVTVVAAGGTIAGSVSLSGNLVPVYSRAAASGGAPADLPWPTLSADLGGADTRPRHSSNSLVVYLRPETMDLPRAGSAELRQREATSRAGGRMRAMLEERLAGRRGRVQTVIPAAAAARVLLDSPESLEAIRAHLASDPHVARVEREPLAYAHQVVGGRLPTDHLWSLQSWHYTAMDLPRAWAYSTGSSSVTVAVVDDGIRFGHPELAGNLTNDGIDFVSAGNPVSVCGGGVIDSALDGNGWDNDPTTPAFFSPSGNCVVPQPVGGHGLHVAGTIAAREGNNAVVGVNWNVRIRPVRVLGAGGGTLFDIASGILYAAGLPVEYAPGQYIQAPSRAHVINLSLGGTGGAEVYCPVVAAATAAGSLVVASAGNSNVATPAYPAACPDALSVIAVRPDLTRASYSNYGTTTDIAAPGGELNWGDDSGIMSTLWDFAGGQPTLGFYQGTSMAAPHVSGLAALILSVAPGLNPAQLRARIVNYAVDLGAPGPDPQFGAGLINARNSLTQTTAAQRAVHARLYDAGTGQALGQVPVGAGGQFTFERVPAGNYFVMAGEDERGDGVFGTPGVGLAPRRWGGHGVGGRIAPVPVQRGATSQAPVSVGFPSESEPNNTAAAAGRLMVGGYVMGVRNNPTDMDVYALTVPTGTYTIETAGWMGACGLALEEDTQLRLFNAAGAEVGFNDDINPQSFNRCSRLTGSLPAGTYYLAVTGKRTGGAGTYLVSVRSGS